MRRCAFLLAGLIALAPVLGLAGCTGPAPTPSPLPSPTPPPTVTPSPSATPSPSVTPTASATFIPPFPTPASTHVLTHAIIDNVFFGGSSPGCELPCWHGLIVGKSTYEEVLDAFDQAFDFGGLPYAQVRDPSGSSPEYIDHIHIGHGWYQDLYGRSTYIFGAGAYVSRETGKLEELTFSSANYVVTRVIEFHPDLSPSRVLRELGKPTYWLMEYQGGGQGEGFHLRTRSLIVYDNGMYFYYSADIPAATVRSNGSWILKSQFCLNDNFDVSATIARPLVHGFTDLSPFEEAGLGIRRGMRPVEDVLGVSQEDLIGRAQTEVNPCITLQEPA